MVASAKTSEKPHEESFQNRSLTILLLFVVFFEFDRISARPYGVTFFEGFLGEQNCRKDIFRRELFSRGHFELAKRGDQSDVKLGVVQQDLVQLFNVFGCHGVSSFKKIRFWDTTVPLMGEAIGKAP